MLDIAFIRENKELVEKASKDKGVDIDVSKFIELDDKRRELIQKTEEIRAERNKISASNKGNKPSSLEIEKVKDLKQRGESLEKELEKVEADHKSLWSKIPNVPSKYTPVGPDETANKVIRTVGEKPKFDFEPKANWDLGTALGIIDMERAAKMSGARFAYLKGGLVRMQFALISWVMDLLSSESTINQIANDAGLSVPEKGFLPVITPDMLRPEVFERTGRLDPSDDKYYLEKDNLYLAGSAEQTLLPMYMDEILDESMLPIRHLGYSTAFRREAGSYGKDTRGILRVHQFDKLEMQTICTPSQSENEFNLYLAIQEHLMQQLGIHYQVVEISTGDMGKPDYRQIDIEAWMPGQNAFRETHTADNNTDYQARRLNVRYRDKEGNVQLTHMHDGTALAFSRVPIAIMETYQTKNGSIRIPEVLKPYMNGLEEVTVT